MSSFHSFLRTAAEKLVLPQPVSRVLSWTPFCILVCDDLILSGHDLDVYFWTNIAVSLLHSAVQIYLVACPPKVQP